MGIGKQNDGRGGEVGDGGRNVLRRREEKEKLCIGKERVVSSKIKGYRLSIAFQFSHCA